MPQSDPSTPPHPDPLPAGGGEGIPSGTVWPLSNIQASSPPTRVRKELSTASPFNLPPFGRLHWHLSSSARLEGGCAAVFDPSALRAAGPHLLSTPAGQTSATMSSPVSHPNWARASRSHPPSPASVLPWGPRSRIMTKLLDEPPQMSLLPRSQRAWNPSARMRQCPLAPTPGARESTNRCWRTRAASTSRRSAFARRVDRRERATCLVQLARRPPQIGHARGSAGGGPVSVPRSRCLAIHTARSACQHTSRSWLGRRPVIR